ncbi:hypothetical protein HMPREF1551_00555 [Capnocytophaga sp. oral taxon 863 str. F0517]|uniref:hypothetical protein n=1 Tax=Capnocytophaga sp. oral taxon 863 TaxID=1227265 RepID=UPI000395EE94|nr:hypothetical protein [Capnocytophaga sp. oral taxon 863]ERI64316.1 hypothetical protein HMPREF1551_00555 [Capnocytophaga sp. oral taxon 863 str. F0517]
MKTLDLKEVRDRFELYKVAFNKKPYVNNLANELGVKTTTLMKFIVNNDKHFVLYQNDKGTYISEIYLDLKDKPGSDEFVEYNKEKYKNTLFLDTYSYPYNEDVIEFHRIIEDKKDEERSNEWRNTSEKIKTVKKFISDTKVSIGMDIYRYDDFIPKENIELLISQGWEFVNYNKNSEE